MNEKKSNIVWLYYAYGFDPKLAFCNSNSDPRLAACLGPQLNETLQKAGYEVKLYRDGMPLEDFAAFIAWSVNPELLAVLAKHPREKCFLLVMEPPVVAREYYESKTKERFGKIFVLLDDFVDNKTYFKIFHPFPTFQMHYVAKENSPDFMNKKLCCLINANKFFNPYPEEIYTERKRLVSFFTNTGEFDLYGKGWEGLPSWKGIAPDNKSDVLKNYKFSICYENTYGRRGYITERIFNPFFARCVPVYYGAPDITEYVPKTCFIDKRDFPTYPDLYQYMKNMNRKTYEDYVEAGIDYINNSKNFNKFTNESVIIKMIEQLQKLSLV